MIQAKARPIKDLVGRDISILEEAHGDAIAQDLHLSLLDVYRATLELGIYRAGTSEIGIAFL